LYYIWPGNRAGIFSKKKIKTKQIRKENKSKRKRKQAARNRTSK